MGDRQPDHESGRFRDGRRDARGNTDPSSREFIARMNEARAISELDEENERRAQRRRNDGADGHRS